MATTDWSQSISSRRGRRCTASRTTYMGESHIHGLRCQAVTCLWVPADNLPMSSARRAYRATQRRRPRSSEVPLDGLFGRRQSTRGFWEP